MALIGEQGTETWCLVGDTLPDLASAIAWSTLDSSGAVVTFTGTVRDHADGYEHVTAVTYEAFEAEAHRRLLAIAQTAHERWPELDRIALWHRTGAVQLGEASVHVVVSSPHRERAFKAAQFCIDVLKVSVPVWKFEHAAGSPGWTNTGVEASSVEAAAQRWIAEHA